MPIYGQGESETQKLARDAANTYQEFKNAQVKAIEILTGNEYPDFLKDKILKETLKLTDQQIIDIRKWVNAKL